MKLPLTLLFLILIFSTSLYGQISQYFIEENPRDSFPNKMPSCVTYSHEEQMYFGAIYHTDTVDGELTDIFETNEHYERDENRILPLNFVKKHLLPDVKFIHKTGGKNNDSSFTESIDDYLDAEFYALHTILKGKVFTAVVYERIFTRELTGSEKFLCTYNKSGKFISRILISSFVYSGTGMSVSGARIPWFPLNHGCINPDLTISFISQTDGNKKYKILSNGQIVETE